MEENKFEWDENKYSSNKEKHKIDFEEAKKIFDDENRIETEDTRYDYGEKRFITIGKVLNAILFVVYTIREKAIRIISARRANQNERNDYISQLKK